MDAVAYTPSANGGLVPTRMRSMGDQTYSPYVVSFGNDYVYIVGPPPVKEAKASHHKDSLRSPSLAVALSSGGAIGDVLGSLTVAVTGATVGDISIQDGDREPMLLFKGGEATPPSQYGLNLRSSFGGWSIYVGPGLSVIAAGSFTKEASASEASRASRASLPHIGQA